MAAIDGQTPDPVNQPPAPPDSGTEPVAVAPTPAELALRRTIEAIAARPYAFDFFQAARLLQCAGANLPRLGSSHFPEEDPVRFGQRPSLAFAPSTLDGLQLGDPPKLFVNFFGLFGPNGPLPLHLTDYAIRRQLGQNARGKDFTLSAFCDVFHHRLLSLFFRAWACNQQVVDFDRPDDQRFPFYLGSSFGLASETDEHGDFHPHPDALPVWAKLYYAGHLACPTRHAEGLQSILQDYFSEPAEIQTFQGRWLELPTASLCQLGNSPDTGSLGTTAIAGSRIWDSQLSFRIRLGPMRFSDFTRFLPGSRSLERLQSWVVNYAGAQYFWDLQVVLAAKDVPDTQLASDRPPQMGRLGQTTWLKSKPFDQDSEDLVLNPG
jgi:type VI secretion system protein ImpH